MPSRRDFISAAAALSGGALTRGRIPGAIARAFAIDPDPGSTWLDAEHIVVLMQENRSFDHCFGSLRGVRGFRDPRVHLQPDGRPAWFQTDAQGRTYAPFHLDITGTNATWLGGLPHSWPDQVDARGGGRFDKWLIAKPPKGGLPFTLGHYHREDIPFYYALADAFTVCDQAFCSSLTGTTANRLFLWTGNIRKDAADTARVDNADTRYEHEAAWTTFPERLEDAGVSWRIYQNEISLDSGFEGEEDGWLANFTDNPIEWFTQYHVRFAKSHRAWLPQLIELLPAKIAAAERAAEVSGLAPAETAKRRKLVTDLKAQLDAAMAEQAPYNEAAWSALAPREKALHERAFTTNDGDPAYRSVTSLVYQQDGTPREVQVPAGDTLFRFRQDVVTGKLPAVSWLVAPENFSDHPSAPWYGAWYVSEVLDILTKNPEVWKKTVFVLCYDENDGYFDHVPPFTAPHPARPETGAVSPGIDTAVDWANVRGRDHSIGLGFRVPLVVASPWSRGGCVNSEVADHTSVVRLMERWLAAKGKHVRETNISEWRRTVCGDLSSVFQPYHGEALPLPAPIGRDATVERIHAAKFQPRPQVPVVAAPAAMAGAIGFLQEPGTRPSCPLPYDLHVNADLIGETLTLLLEARNSAFGRSAQGAPFNAYLYGKEMTCRAYAVRAGAGLRDKWAVDGGYHLKVDGPNGFMRSFTDGATRTPLHVAVDYRSGNGATGRVDVRLTNRGSRELAVALQDDGYHAPRRDVVLNGGATKSLAVTTDASGGWYDFSVRAGDLVYRYAGRVETGKWSVTDPAMG